MTSASRRLPRIRHSSACFASRMSLSPRTGTILLDTTVTGCFAALACRAATSIDTAELVSLGFSACDHRWLIFSNVFNFQYFTVHVCKGCNTPGTVSIYCYVFGNIVLVSTRFFVQLIHAPEQIRRLFTLKTRTACKRGCAKHEFEGSTTQLLWTSWC